MKIEVKETKDNKLLGREEYFLKIEHTNEETPSKDKLAKKFAAENDLDPEKIELEGIQTAYGSGISKVKAKVHEEKVRDLSENEEDSEDEEEEEE